MPLVAIVLAAFAALAALAVGFEQLVQSKYGPMGVIGLVALTIGLRARNTLVSGAGAVILVMPLAQSG